MNNLLLPILLVGFITGCAVVNPDDLNSWRNQPVEKLDTHSYFLTIPVEIRNSSSGITVRKYYSGPCQNIFTIKNNVVIRYQVAGACYTDYTVRPEW